MSERDEYTRFRGASVADDVVTILWQKNETEFLVLEVSMADEGAIENNTGVKVSSFPVESSTMDAMFRIYESLIGGE